MEVIKLSAGFQYRREQIMGTATELPKSNCSNVQNIHRLRIQKMKKFLLALPLLVSACATTHSDPAQNAAKQYFIGGGPSAAAQIPASTQYAAYSAGAGDIQSNQISNGQVKAPGLYKTSSGTPWKVYQSINVRRGRNPLDGTPAIQAAMSYGSHQWKEPYATPVTVDGANAMFRITTIDAHTYAVVSKIRTPFFDGIKKQNGSIASLLELGVRKSNCGQTGTAVVRRGKYQSIQAAAVPVSCY